LENLGQNYWKRNKYEFCDLWFSSSIAATANEIHAYRHLSFENEDCWEKWREPNRPSQHNSMETEKQTRDAR